jgi:hypothetical protein
MQKSGLVDVCAASDINEVSAALHQTESFGIKYSSRFGGQRQGADDEVSFSQGLLKRWGTGITGDIRDLLRAAGPCRRAIAQLGEELRGPSPDTPSPENDDAGIADLPWRDRAPCLLGLLYRIFDDMALLAQYSTCIW